MEDVDKDTARIFPVVPGDRPEATEELQEIPLTVRVTKPCHRWSKEVVESPYLEM